VFGSFASLQSIYHAALRHRMFDHASDGASAAMASVAADGRVQNRAARLDRYELHRRGAVALFNRLAHYCRCEAKSTASRNPPLDCSDITE
jgi:hypothetical protein